MIILFLNDLKIIKYIKKKLNFIQNDWFPMGMELAKGWKTNKNNKVPLLCTFKIFESMHNKVSLFLAALEMMELLFHIKFQNTN